MSLRRLAPIGAAACLLLGSCADVPRPFLMEDMDAAVLKEDGVTKTQSGARISFSHPQIFSREALINDRLENKAFIEALLAKSVDEKFESQLRRDLTLISSFAAQVGLTFDPAAKVDFNRAKELDDLKQEIEVTKMRAELSRVQQAYQQLQAGTGTGPDKPADTKPGSASATNIDQSAAKAQLDAVVERVKGALDKLENVAKAMARQASGTQSPEDRFKDLQAYRASLRSAWNTTNLDDVHDKEGYGLFRMQFAASVFPGADISRRQWGVASVAIAPAKLTAIDIERLYLRWMSYSTERLNRVGADGHIQPDGTYMSLVDGNNLLGLIDLPIGPAGSGSGLRATQVRSNTKDRFYAVTNPEQMHVIVWLFSEKARYTRIHEARDLLTAYVFNQPLDEKYVAMIEAARAEAVQARDCGAFGQMKPPPAAKGKKDKPDGTADFARAMAEIIERRESIALAAPFLVSALRAAEAVTAERDEAKRRSDSRKSGAATPRGAPEKGASARPAGTAEMGSIEDIAWLAGDLLWLVEKLFEDVCPQQARALQEKSNRIAVPCAFASAIIDGVSNCGNAMREELRGSTLRETRIQGRSRTQTLELRQSVASGRGASQLTWTPPDDTTQYSAKGYPVVYSIAPAEEAQRLSSVASAANSAQVALGLAAGMPQSGLGLQAGIGSLKAAAGNADALERLPLVVSFADERSEGQDGRFGWVFGPKAYIQTPEKGDPRIALRHGVARHEVSVDMSVPVWWPRVTLQFRTAWVANQWDNVDAVLADEEKAKIQEMEINRPISYGDLDSLTAYLLRGFPPYGVRRVRVDRVEPSTLALCQEGDTDLTVLVYGLNLWRNPEAYLMGSKATKVAVLPDMQGIAATFTLNQVQKAAGGPRALVVWTQSGQAEELIDVRFTADKCAGKKEGATPPKAPPALKVTAKDVTKLPVDVSIAFPDGTDEDALKKVKLKAAAKGHEKDLPLAVENVKVDGKTLTATLTTTADASLVQKLLAGGIEIQVSYDGDTGSGLPAMAALKMKAKSAAAPSQAAAPQPGQKDSPKDSKAAKKGG